MSADEDIRDLHKKIEKRDTAIQKKITEQGKALGGKLDTHNTQLGNVSIAIAEIKTLLSARPYPCDKVNAVEGRLDEHLTEERERNQDNRRTLLTAASNVGSWIIKLLLIGFITAIALGWRPTL